MRSPKKISLMKLPKIIFLLALSTLLSNAYCQDWQLNLEQGKKLFKSGSYKEAILEFDKGIDSNTKSSEIFYFRGLSKVMLKEFDAALLDAKMSAKLDPFSPQARYLYAGIKMEQGDYLLAIKEYSNVIDIAPYFPTTYRLRAEAKIKMEDYNGAIEDLDAAIDLEPDYANAYSTRGYCKFKINETKLACADYKKAYKMGIKEANEMITMYCK